MTKVNMTHRSSNGKIIVEVSISGGRSDKDIYLTSSEIRQYLIDNNVKFGNLISGPGTLTNNQSGTYVYDDLSHWGEPRRKKEDKPV